MTESRRQLTTEQIELAVDFITENYVRVSHPEDSKLNLFTHSSLQKHIQSMTEQEKKARDDREAEYTANFKKTLSSYISTNQLSGIRSDYGVQNNDLNNAVKATNAFFCGSFWEVRLTDDGKVFSCSGKYDLMGKEVLPKAKIKPEESKAPTFTAKT